MKYFRDNKDKFDIKDLQKKALESGASKKEVEEAVKRIELEEQLLVPEPTKEPEIPISKKEEKKKTLFAKLSKGKTKIKEMPILFLRNSGKAESRKIIPKNGMFEIEGRVYHEKHGSDWDLVDGINKKKIKIIPEWGLYPMGNSDYLDELKSEQAEVQHDIIRAIQTAETVRYNEEKGRGKGVNPKIAVLAIIAIIVIGYIVWGGM